MRHGLLGHRDEQLPSHLGTPIRGRVAEGGGSKVVAYELMSADLNREVHDLVEGSSLYDNPQHYLDVSPSMHFKGLSTACLFESGMHLAAMDMLGYGKAAQRFGMPAENIAYLQQMLPRQKPMVSLARVKPEGAAKPKAIANTKPTSIVEHTGAIKPRATPPVKQTSAAQDKSRPLVLGAGG